MNLSIKLKMADLVDFVKKENLGINMQEIGITSIFDAANTNKENDEVNENGEQVAVLTGEEINNFFDSAFEKLKDTAYDIYKKLSDFYYTKTNEMYDSIKRDLTPEQKEQIKNLENEREPLLTEQTRLGQEISQLNRRRGIAAGLCIYSAGDKELNDRATEHFNTVDSAIGQTQKELDDVDSKIKCINDQIREIEYDYSKLDTSKYVNLDDNKE